MNTNNKYFLAAVTTYAIWGFLPLCLKQLQMYDNFEIVLYRVLISALVMSCIVLLSFSKTTKALIEGYKKSKKEFFTMLILTTLGAAFLATNWTAYVYTVNFVSIKTAAFSYMVFPIISTLLGSVFFKDKLGLRSWIAIIISMISCYILGNVAPKESIFVFIIAVSYSLYIISQRRNNLLPKHINLALQMIICGILMMFFNPVHSTPSALPAHFWGYITLIACLFTVIPLFINLFAISKLKTAELSYLMYISPIISFLIGVIIYNERLNNLAFISYGLLFIAIIIQNWDWMRKIFAPYSVKFLKFKKIR